MSDQFADIATVIAQFLSPLVGPGHTGIATPDNLAGHLPFVRATRAGGPRDRISDHARIYIDVFDTDYDRGHTTAETIAAYLEPGRLRQGPVLIDRVVIDSAPQEIAPWAPGIFRFETRYTIVSRRHRAA